jgi:hypothetical protein
MAVGNVGNYKNRKLVGKVGSVKKSLLPTALKNPKQKK